MACEKKISGDWMVRNSLGRRALCVFMAFLVLIIPLCSLAQETATDFVQGKVDGQKDAKGSPLWFLAGVGCGVIGVGVAFLVKPNPPASSLVGKSADYILGYTEGYRDKARNQDVMWACSGWVVFVVVYVAAGGLKTTD